MSIFRFSRSDRFIKKIFLAVSLVLVLAVAASLDLSKPASFPIQNPVHLIGYWIELPVHTLLTGISSVWSDYLFLVRTREKNIQLQKEIEILKGENNNLRESQLENERLKKLLDLTVPPLPKAVAAEVILRDPTNWYQSLTINKGTSQGIRPGMGVISPSGIVGRILKAGPRSAVVQLITDENSAVAALVSRTRDQGILEGTVRGMTRLKYLSVDLKLSVGDQVVTSGLTPTFPKGLMIGTIIRLDQNPDPESRKNVDLPGSDPFLTVEVAPAVNFSRLENVMVIEPSAAATNQSGEAQRR